MLAMTKAQRGARKPAEDKKKKNFTLWTSEPDAERIQRAVDAVSERTGYPVSVSAWLLSVVLRAVDDEEKRTKGGNGR